MTVSCPFCGETGEIDDAFDPDQPGDQVYIQDCGVCCRPWTVRVHVAHDGRLSVSVDRA